MILVLLLNRGKKLIYRRINRMKILVLFFSLFWFSASGFLYFEMPAKPDLAWGDALWWSFVTMTTVGYGDYFPTTAGGRFLIGLPTMLLGIGFLGFIISEVTSRLLYWNTRRAKGMADLNLKKHILIINYSNLEHIVRILEELRSDTKTERAEICLIDQTLEMLPGELLQYKLNFVRGNPTSEGTLRRACLEHAAQAIILSKEPGNIQSDYLNLSTTLMIEKINPDIFTITEVVDPEKIRQMELAGCDSTVCVSRISANLITQELQDHGTKKVFEELTSNRFGHQIYLTALEQQNKTYRDIVLWGLDNSYSVLGLVRSGQTLLNPAPAEALQNEDRVILVGAERIKSVPL